MKLPIAPSPVIRESLLDIARTRRGMFAAVVIFELCAAVSTVAVPFIIGRLIDRISSGTDQRTVVVMLILIGVFVVGQTAFAFIGDYLARIFGEDVFAQLRERFMASVTHLPLSVVESAGTGDLIGRTTHDVSSVQYLVRQGVSRVIVIVLSSAAILIASLITSSLLAIPLLLSLPFLFVVARWYVVRAVPAYQTSGAQFARMSGVTTETIEQAATVDALNMAQVRNDTYDAVLAGTWRVDRYTSWLRAFMLGGLAIIFLVPVVFVVILGAWAVPRDLTTIGAVTTVALYGMQLRGPLQELTFWIDTIQSAQTALSRIFGVDMVEADRTPSGEELHGTDIRVRDVCYAYREGRDVLHHVTLDLNPGETLAIVGPSGAGKSTLGRMIAGIHPPTRGRVEVGGVRLVDLPEQELHRHVALVTQEHHVFVGSILDNMRLARPDATVEEVRQALADVGALDWVDALDDGVNTAVGSGNMTLSAAQAQQLALARIILINPHTLVLDEATSLLDPTSARTLEQTLARVLHGRTVVAIAHRLYTAHDADRIAVMVDGRIVELGSHDELVALDGEYASLWKAWSYE